MVPPLWLAAFLPNETISRPEAGSTSSGFASALFHSLTTVR
jgi:hypothetical protein